MNDHERRIMEEARTALLGAVYLLEDALMAKGPARHRLAEILRYTQTGLPVLGIALNPAAEAVIRRWHNTCPSAPAADTGE